MSTQLIDHNEDLRKLREEGYSISIVNSNILVKDIPYVNKNKEIKSGMIFCPLNLSGEKVMPPANHTVFFVGEHPCKQNGIEDKTFVNSLKNQKLIDGIISSYFFSSKPKTGRYNNFYDKITRYIELLSAPAKSIDPGITAKQFNYKEYG